MNTEVLLQVFFLLGFTAVMAVVIPGIGLWMICGCPDLKLKYVHKIIFLWPLLLLSKSFYARYMEERSKELSLACDKREADKIRRDKEYWARESEKTRKEMQK